MSIIIPSPAAEFVEIGSNNRTVLEIGVPQTTRLLCGFVLTNDLSRLTKGEDDFYLVNKAVVGVNRKNEFVDFEVSAFKEVVDSLKTKLGDINSITSSIDRVEDEFNRRMKSLNLDECQVSISHPMQLGCFFSKPGAYGFGMLSMISMGGHITRMGTCSAVVYAKRRILFVNLYAEYKNENTIKWLRQTMEKWCDSILKANQ